MLGYIVRRLTYGMVTLLALSFIVFVLMQAAGDPLGRLNSNPLVTPEYRESLTKLYGLDQPLMTQYWKWLSNFVQPDTSSWQVLNMGQLITSLVVLVVGTIGLLQVPRRWKHAAILGLWAGAGYFILRSIVFRFKWGFSFDSGGVIVWNEVFERIGGTFRLGVAALSMALLIGISLGIYQATKQYSFFDQLGTVGAFVAFSTPIFVVGVGLQILAAFYLERWTGVKFFFVAGMTGDNYSDLGMLAQLGDIARHLTLPALSIALISTATYSRFQRASMLEVLSSDYLRTAKAKGLSRRRILIKHAARNALLPIVTVVSLDFALIIGGAIITESIFGWPGLGRRYIEAINGIDYPVVMAIVMLIGGAIVVMNVVADILYGVLDPRVRFD
jgi:peptide/nickel transport system permease protein